MGKRSDFARRPMDDYPTIDGRSVRSLAPYVRDITTFAEPCCGAGDLVRMLETIGLICVYAGDIKTGKDALVTDDFNQPSAIITNPPWTRIILHRMVLHFQRIAPTWLLFDADWAHTRQAIPFMDQCSHIVAIGRLKWIPNSPFTGKDNCAWYRFDHRHSGGPRFYPQASAEAA